MNTRTLLPLLFIIAVSCKSQENVTDNLHQSHPAKNETLFATLWTQTAAEYEALSLQAYLTAGHFLDNALNDSSWTASLEQDPGYESLPPAIILDVDETVLDNSFYQARIIQDGTRFDPETWNSWVREARATSIAGAVEFTNLAYEKGISIYYVTNRESEVEQWTLQNLKDEGFPVEEGAVLSNGARPGWTSAKTERRKFVAGNYRILMLFGDDLNDFLPARNLTVDERKQLIETHRQKWGYMWFILPNPVYGSWERSLYIGAGDLSDKEQMDLWLEWLDRRDIE